MLVILFMNVIAPLIDYPIVRANVRRRASACLTRNRPATRSPSRRPSASSARCWSRCPRSACASGRRPTRSSTGRRTCCSRRASSSPARSLPTRELLAVFDAQHPRAARRSRERATSSPRAASTPTTYDQRKARNDPAQSRTPRRRTPPEISRLPNYGTRLLRRRTGNASGSSRSCSRSRASACGARSTASSRSSATRHDARPHLLRPEGDARPGRRGRQPAVAGAVARAQGYDENWEPQDRRHQGRRRAAGTGPAPRRRAVRRDDHEQRRHAADAVLARRTTAVGRSSNKFREGARP